MKLAALILCALALCFMPQVTLAQSGKTSGKAATSSTQSSGKATTSGKADAAAEKKKACQNANREFRRSLRPRAQWESKCS